MPSLACSASRTCRSGWTWIAKGVVTTTSGTPRLSRYSFMARIKRSVTAQASSHDDSRGAASTAGLSPGSIAVSALARGNTPLLMIANHLQDPGIVGGAPDEPHQDRGLALEYLGRGERGVKYQLPPSVE